MPPLPDGLSNTVYNSHLKLHLFPRISFRIESESLPKQLMTLQHEGFQITIGLGRAYSVAGQQRMEQASEVLPGLRKQWRRSGKLRTRLTHDAIGGQLRDADKAFSVAGASLMFPRDPAGPTAETVNRGCQSLPWMESWGRSGIPGARRSRRRRSRATRFAPSCEPAPVNLLSTTTAGRGGTMYLPGRIGSHRAV